MTDINLITKRLNTKLNMVAEAVENEINNNESHSITKEQHIKIYETVFERSFEESDFEYYSTINGVDVLKLKNSILYEYIVTESVHRGLPIPELSEDLKKELAEHDYVVIWDKYNRIYLGKLVIPMGDVEVACIPGYIFHINDNCIDSITLSTLEDTFTLFGCNGNNYLGMSNYLTPNYDTKIIKSDTLDLLYRVKKELNVFLKKA